MSSQPTPVSVGWVPDRRRLVPYTLVRSFPGSMMDSDAPPHSDPFKTVSAAAMHSWLPADLFAGFPAMSSDTVIPADEQQRIIFFNPAATQSFRWRATEVGSRPPLTPL